MRELDRAHRSRRPGDRRGRSFIARYAVVGAALVAQAALAPQDAAASVDLVGSWSGENNFEGDGFTYTPGAGTDRLVLVMISSESDTNPVANIGSVTLGGQTLTAIESADGIVVGTAGTTHNILWLGYLKEAGIASMSGNALSITWDQAPNNPLGGDTMIQAATYQNVNQTTPIIDSASNTNASNTTIQAGSVTVGTCDRVVYGTLIAYPYNHTAPTGYTEQLELDTVPDGHSSASAQRDATTSGTENPTATWSGTQRLAMISAVLNSGEPNLIVADHTAGQQTDAFTQSGSATNAELFGFELDSGGATISVTQLVFSLSGLSGLTDGDWAGVEIVVDDNNDGNIGVGEVTTVGGAGSVNQAAGTITFSTSFNVTTATNYILRADFASLSESDSVTITLDPTDVSTTACVDGSTSSIAHVEGCRYVECYQTWTATSADTWQTKTLGAAPFNVPASAVVEIAVRNSNSTDTELSGGVRAVGSSLERRFTIHEAQDGGYDVLVMHAAANASAQIQHYADDTAEVDFVLLGYWPAACGTYVEAFDSFTAGASASWQDENLSAYGVGNCDVAEIVMSNADAAAEREAGVRLNGSSLQRIYDLHEAEAGGVDVGTMFVQADGTASATIEVYAEDDTDVSFRLVGYWSTTPGSYNELFVDVGSPASDATWTNLDLTSSGVPDGAIVEMALSNEDIDEENNFGLRENGSPLARLLNLHEAEDGGEETARMHVSADSTATVEFYHQDVSDAYTFRLLGYWVVGGTSQILSDHIAGQETDAFTEQGGETNAELLGFQLDPLCDTITITQIVFRISSIFGLVNGDWAGVEIVVDTNNDGTIGAGETTTVGGAGVVDQAAGTITFSTSFNVPGSVTNYIVRADFASLSTGDTVTISLDNDDISTVAVVTGATSSVTHLESCYTEKLQSWTATSADTWQTKDLSVSPFNVPASAVVEIAVRNANTTDSERWGGVRAVGSSLERRFQLQEAEAGGYDFVVMHVQADASSQIQHYADDTGDVSFVLLGFWTCGTYQETFDTFTAGASASWQDRNLCTYGVKPSYVAEIVMTNDDLTLPREAGVRTNGSSLERRLDLHNAEAGGVDTATMFVEADTSAAATVELYAEDNADVDFYLVGYWSAAPLAYTELFASAGNPTLDATWQDVDLTGSGVPNSAIAEVVLANGWATEEDNMGVRSNGSSQSRLLNIQEAEDGGTDLGRMQVLSDPTATIEFYHQDVSDTHTFSVVGYWTTCSTSISYIITDLGAIVVGNSSLGSAINASGKLAGWDEDGSGGASAWYSDCGTLTSLGTLGGTNGAAIGINSANKVVGWAQNGSAKRRPFTWTSGGGMTDLGVLSGRTDGEALAVNASGEVVGTCTNFGAEPTDYLAFIFLPVAAYTLSSGMTSLGTLGGELSVATDINASGQVVGGAENTSDYMRPFRWANGTMTDLGTLGGNSGKLFHRANAINASGNVAGMSYTAGGAQHAFFWNGSMSDLGVLTGGTTSTAFGINDSNVVVGTSNVTGGAFRAFVWDATNGMRNLNSLIDSGSGWTLVRATDIGSDGSITGWGTNPSSRTRAFLLTPSCSAGGGGATATFTPVLARADGIVDELGGLDATAVTPDGEVVAEIEIRGAEAGAVVELVVEEPESGPEGQPAPDPAGMEGFRDGIALARTAAIATGMPSGTYRITVSLATTEDELADLGVRPDEVELHVLETEGASLEERWVPAGVNVGRKAPTGVLGQSGFVEDAAGKLAYWAIREAAGTFAIGAAAAAGDSAEVEPTLPRPRVCGLGMMPALALMMVGLGLARVLSTRARFHVAQRTDR